MPKHLRAKVAFQFHDADPKNTAAMNPCFRHQTWQLGEDPLPVDAQALAVNIADAFQYMPGATGPYTVKLYDIEKAKPNFPLATEIRNPAVAPKAVSVVPEAAVVLSFYADVNQPRHRGRIYLPAWLLGATTSDMGREIGAQLRANAAALADSFAGVGGGNVDWGVWSSVDHAFHKATNYYISYAWGTVRSRGIKASNRESHNTSG